jgi:CheY-like chemotaxis protein
VLDISRIEAGKLQLSVEPVCIGHAVAEAIDLMRPLASERSIELVVAVEQDQSHVLGDRQRLKQVLLNLLTNGIKYTPKGGRVTVSAAPAEADRLRVVVSDTGPGIAAENLSRLFTPFDRLGAEQSDVQGTGLGLAVSQRLIQAMGGSIGVTSDLGKGSTFWIDLPRTKSPLERVTKSNTKVAQKVPRPAVQDKRRILYIEDNLSNLTLVQQILEEQGDVDLLTAMQGSIGLDLARRHAPELILLDLHLPDMPGWDVLSRLKGDPATRSIPTIVISADATRPQIKRLMSAGATAYLTKPLDVEQFVRVLEKNSHSMCDTTEPSDKS